MGLEVFYGQLELEPLYWTLDYIAEQTDEQILMVLAAAAKRANEMNGTAQGPAFDPEQATEEEQRMQMASLGRILGLSQAEIDYQWEHRNEIVPAAIPNPQPYIAPAKPDPFPQLPTKPLKQRKKHNLIPSKPKKKDKK